MQIETYPDSIVIRWQWRVHKYIHQHSWTFSFEALTPVEHSYFEVRDAYGDL